MQVFMWLDPSNSCCVKPFGLLHTQEHLSEQDSFLGSVPQTHITRDDIKRLFRLNTLIQFHEVITNSFQQHTPQFFSKDTHISKGIYSPLKRYCVHAA